MEAVGRLAGGVAHDFNNLMAAILSYADLVLQSLPRGDKHRDDVEEIKRAGRHAAELTRQLLAFSRQQVMNKSVLDLNEVIHDELGLLRRLVGSRVTVETTFDPDPWRIKGDRLQIEQVLLNLATNARDAMPDGGTLFITTRRVTIAADDATVRPLASGDYVLLEVRDTGTGIAPEIRSKIFDPFFTTKEVGKGTGLGLATVYGIVRQTGGLIYVDSEPGQGATFSIYLPRTTDAPEHWPGRTSQR
jgi:two-component system cell cycle sensor histidine kinase/response regulator CckA